ncbi:uncharacterized protein LOC106157951 [Lingula anatina]|uniref:Uncharacterized protein LOC106157951 n=1 Tax=Lingula anatina TaxID=7574 RepID=A0A1S3HT68_LINAN|nr:uncharacterized protein LOC106157951 [Lingula anatina]|eukprot:XP_013389213.1 uncharacterized protein LOC106157951 [Lingula anatina]
MVHKHCAYGTCNSDSRHADRPHMAGVFFVPFPKPKTNVEKCKRWVHLCGRHVEQFNIDKVSKYTFLCSKHFVGGNGPTEENPDPISARACPEQVSKINRRQRKAPKQRTFQLRHTEKLAKNEQLEVAEALLDLGRNRPPTCQTPEIHKLSLEISNALPSQESEQEITLQYPSTCQTTEIQDFAIDTFNDPPYQESEQGNVRQYRSFGVQTDDLLCNCNKDVETTDASAQTVYTKYELQAKIETIALKNELVRARTVAPTKAFQDKTDAPLLTIDGIKDDKKTFFFFTGLEYLHFLALFTFLGPAVNNLTYWNGKSTNKLPSRRKTKPIDELFMTLVRLRRGYSFFSMSFFFKLSQTVIRSIFTTWIQLLYHHFNDLRPQMFADRSTLRPFLPKSFRSFQNVRCSVDCTEFYVQMPKDFARQGNLYSSYKHHHTFKCCIAVAPNGSGVFVSHLFEGSISDREIFKKCGILDYLNPGDMILVDRGFTVKDILQELHVDVNMPAFLNGRESLTPQEELLTKRLAKARIHVERYNGRVKNFKLISGTIPLSLAPLASQSVFVVCCLVNFQDQLAK